MMNHYTRRFKNVNTRNKPHLITCLRYEFGFTCCYCGRHEEELSDGFHVDHFIPRHEDESKIFDYDNLYYCCSKCNSFKGMKWPNIQDKTIGREFVDPCREPLVGKHAIQLSNGFLRPTTKAGEYTISNIRLNRPTLVLYRKRDIFNKLEYCTALGSIFRSVTDLICMRNEYLGSQNDLCSKIDSHLNSLEVDLGRLLGLYRRFKIPYD